MRALVTGAGGFVGQWLCAELLRDSWAVHGATLNGPPATGTLRRWQREAVVWRDADLRLRRDVESAVDAARPDAIFHLAAVSHVPAAESDPEGARASNVGIARTILDVVAERRRAGALDPVVVIAGSAEEYGPHALAEMPLAETAPLRPQTVYARTKVEQEGLALERWHSDGVRVIATRPFNHTGPGQVAPFLVPSLLTRARDALAQGRDTIAIGNTDIVRDFLHVADVVRAYIYLALRGVAGEVYNICSGIGTSVADIAQTVCACAADIAVTTSARRQVVPPRPVTDPALLRPVDVPALVGDPAKLTRHTSWTPRYDLTMAVADLAAFETPEFEDAEED